MEKLSSLLDAQEAELAGIGEIAWTSRELKPLTIVMHANLDPAIYEFHVNYHVGSVGVPAHIVQGFLHNAK